MNESVINLIVSHINDHLKNGRREFAGGPVSHFTCRDGTRISVQASEYAYCNPRNNTGPWTHVEVMMVADPICFEKSDDNIAGYVPIELVAQEILLRGNAVLTHCI